MSGLSFVLQQDAVFFHLSHSEEFLTVEEISEMTGIIPSRVQKVIDLPPRNMALERSVRTLTGADGKKSLQNVYRARKTAS